MTIDQFVTENDPDPVLVDVATDRRASMRGLRLVAGVARTALRLAEKCGADAGTIRGLREVLDQVMTEEDV